MLRWLDILKYARYANPEPEKRVEKSIEEWKSQLTAEQYYITREKGTEKPYKNEYCTTYEPGTYACICCNTILFDSYDKYYAISGWPSFTQPISKRVTKYKEDDSFGMKRVEVMCNVCDSHLGHVFNDGPAPGGLRYCINSASIYRIDSKDQLAILGGGCFWCTEALMQKVKGVVSAEPGYAGGKSFNPTYKEVSSGLTGHAEVVRVQFDPLVITYNQLLEIFFKIHDATLINPQKGSYSQYRSIILYYNEEQKAVAESLKADISEKENKALYTEIAPLKAFYKAEEQHQNYYRKNPGKPYCQNVIEPKMNKYF